MGSNTIIAIVVGAILVIVGFSLWPVLNGASNSLYSYFRDSCDDGNGNRFTKAYIGQAGKLPSNPTNVAYYEEGRQHGGSGVDIVDASGSCSVPIITGASPALTANAAGVLYNEQGDVIATGVTVITSGVAAATNLSTGTDYVWLKVAPMLARFSGINNLLLTILPVVSIAGFLGISGAKLYSYGKGTASIGSSISTSVFTLIGIVVAMVIAGPIMGSAVDANQVVVSGQYQVNSTFGNIISLLFAMIPVVYVAGLVTLVGLQARTALMGSNSGGGMG